MVELPYSQRSPGARFLALLGGGLDDGGLEGPEAGGGGEVNLRVGVRAAREQLGFVGGVVEGDVALEDALPGHPDFAGDGEPGALDEGGEAAPEARLELSNELVFLLVKRNDGSGAAALGVEDGAEVLGDDVGIRAEEEEVVTFLDGREPGARDDYGGGATEDLDGGAHGGLELDDLLGGVVLRVDSLLVLDHREGNEAAELAHDLLELVEPDPQIVRVEVPVLLDVLELLLVLTRGGWLSGGEGIDELDSDYIDKLTRVSQICSHVHYSYVWFSLFLPPQRTWPTREG